MNLEFTKQLMKLANVNVRSELHGAEREAASDLKFEVAISNDILSDLDPALKSTFYHYDGARQDLVDAGKKKEPGFLPHLKFPKMAQAIKWNEEMETANIAITEPGAKSAIELKDVKVNNVQFTPKDGGTVVFEFRVQCKPDEKIFGKLAMLVQSDVEVTLSAAE